MLDGLAHGRPLVNGDSGFIPRPFDRAMELFEHGRRRREPALPARGGRAPRGGARARGRAWRRGRAGGGALRAASACSRSTAGAAASVVAAGRAVGHALVASGGIVLSAAGAAHDRPGRLRAVGRAVGRAPARRGVARRRSAGSRSTPAASLADATLSLYRDPRHARGEIRFPPVRARLLRVDSAPARSGGTPRGGGVAQGAGSGTRVDCHIACFQAPCCLT